MLVSLMRASAVEYVTAPRRDGLHDGHFQLQQSKSPFRGSQGNKISAHRPTEAVADAGTDCSSLSPTIITVVVQVPDADDGHSSVAGR
jgi:hypothetical protein